LNEPKPVADWATDFDPTHSAWINDPAPILKEIRSRCPVAHTDRMLGVYLTTTYQAAREVMLNWKVFSSRRVVVRNDRPQQMVLAPPVSVDPPHHTWIKQVLLPVFTQEVTRKLEGHIRETCRSLLAGLNGRKSCDAGQDYAARVAAITLAHLLGVPKEDSGLLLKWIHEMFDVGVTDPVRLFAAIRESEAYFAELVAARRAKNEDDTITLLVNAKDGDGKPLTDAYIQATLRVLMMAGVDTSLCAIASAIWHMSNHPGDRDRLVENPSLVPGAIEEFLRAYPPATAGREVITETEVQGCPMKPDNMVLVSFMAANRDPAVFADPEKVVIDRADSNKHMAFGYGIHRCIGIHLGRAEMTIAVEEWLKAFPKFRPDPAGQLRFSVGQMRGPQHLPILLS